MYTAPILMPSRRNRKSKSSPNADPYAGREAAKYANPIASREHILQHLEEIGQPVGFQDFAFQLQIEDENQLEALRRRLNAMARDGQIIKNRKGAFGLTTHMDLLPGKVQGNKDGSGYFIPDQDLDDLFLPPREMARLFDGDRILVRASTTEHRGRREAAVVEILQRKHEEIVGRYYRDAGFGIVVPDSKRIQHEILVPTDRSKKAKDGQYVVARISEFPNKRRKAVGEIVEILGDVATPGIEIDVALHSFSIPSQWSEGVEKEVAPLPAEVQPADQAARHDLRNIPLVTIDGEDAKDFDDAVFAESTAGGGWRLIVAIADVSHYVNVGSQLDGEAEHRGTSVYFPGHVVPMLPEELSNGLCSLKPQVDRLAMACEMQVLPSGEVGRFQFFEAIIHSHARLTYNEVADMLQKPENENQEKLQQRQRGKHPSQVLENLDALYAVFEARLNWRRESGAIDFDTPETRIVFGEDKKIREIVPVQRNDAHRLIEECMLCANVAAAQLFQAMEQPSLYRVHQGPNPDRLEGLREFLQGMGLILGGGDKPSPDDYQKVLFQIADRPDRNLLQTMLIRSMMQAVYQPDNIGHFGLGFPAYTHFTSPIRRYPDLLVHRAIRDLIRNKQSKHLERHPDQQSLPHAKIYPYTIGQLHSLGEKCSDSERRADAASYSVIDWLKCEYMSDRVGEEFAGTVTSVTSFGLFVELDGIFIEGLIHITDLSNDYYHFDPVHHRLDGERNGKSYRLGDPVEVKIARVDLEEKKIDLHLVGIDKSRSRKVKRRATTKSKGKKPGEKKKGKKASKAGKDRKDRKERQDRKNQKSGKKQKGQAKQEQKKHKPGKKTRNTRKKSASKKAGRGKDKKGGRKS